MLREQFKKSKAFLCLECGKCAAVCPVARRNSGYSPRRLLSQAIATDNPDTLHDEALSSCLTCMACDPICPSGISMTYVIKEIRKAVGFSSKGTVCSHSGAMQSLMHLMTSENLTQNRLDWLSEEPELATSKKGDTLLFIGCLPYFDVFFAEQGAKTLQIAKSAVRVLNAIGIKPVILPNERCCGHDLVWSGDEEGFRRLAEHNIAEITKSGVKRVIFTCPECLLAFRQDYPSLGIDMPFETLHITELLRGEMQGLGAEYELDKDETVVTFQDPCRLVRHLGIEEDPRHVLGWIKGKRLHEMERHGKRALCCAGNTWLNCDRFSKEIQVERLREAKATGAEVLITACPKCQIHFSCAMQDPMLGEEIKIEMKDITQLLAESLTNKREEGEG